jgi:hypothetical protein
MDMLILIISISGWIMALYYRAKAKEYEQKNKKKIEQWKKTR